MTTPLHGARGMINDADTTLDVKSAVVGSAIYDWVFPSIRFFLSLPVTARRFMIYWRFDYLFFAIWLFDPHRVTSMKETHALFSVLLFGFPSMA